MAAKFKRGDKVWLHLWKLDPHLRHLWHPDNARLVGQIMIVENPAYTTTEGYVICSLDFSNQIGYWPEAYLQLVSAVVETPPILLPSEAKSEKPQWLVSRTITLHDGECQKCGAPKPCQYHPEQSPTRSGNWFYGE